MNKVFCRKKRILPSFFTGFLILFNLFLFSACGLDTFFVINAPTEIIHEPTYQNTIDEADRYFEFRTNENQDDSVIFLGTDVYYKIYSDSSRLTSEHSSIMQLANSDNSSNQAADRMIASYRFQPLRAKGHTDQVVLVPNKNSNRRVKIRLVDIRPYDVAQISISDSIVDIPVRALPNSPSFDFFSGADDMKPKSDDADTNMSSSSTDPDVYYVSMFAVAVGQDNTYARLYSNVLYLGSVQISRN